MNTLRNLLYVPMMEMKITFELLRQASLAANTPSLFLECV